MAFVDAVELPVSEIDHLTGVNLAAALTAVDGTNGNKFHNNGKTLLRVKNAAGAEITVTVHMSRTVAGLAVPDLTFTVPATTGDVARAFGLEFNQPGTDFVYITFSSGASVTARAYRLANF